MRYLPLTSDDRAAMLAKIGAADVDALFRDVPKAAVVGRGAFDLPDTQGELEVEFVGARKESYSARIGASRPARSIIGSSVRSGAGPGSNRSTCSRSGAPKCATKRP